MKIDKKTLTVRELVEGYTDDGEDGVKSYDGLLDIRPSYQREFVYDEKKRDAVINSVYHGYPLGEMYWVDREDGTYEILDGQQRTISLAQFVTGKFSFDFGLGPSWYDNAPTDIKEKILDYELTIHICRGTETEKLEWFKVINTSGEPLTNQELRNAVYHGPWISNAKRYFSKVSGPADKISGDYLNTNTLRQETLQRAIEWAMARDGVKTIEDYMSLHRSDPSASDLWCHFQAVIDWIEATFPKIRASHMRKVDWNKLYLKYKDEIYDPQALEAEVAILMADSDVLRKHGIYSYVLDHDEKHLRLRDFDKNQRTEGYERSGGLCARGIYCKTVGNENGDMVFDITEMEADHITPWVDGGRTEVDNLQMLCKRCNRSKGSK